jgi:hypothetical protein
MHRPGGRQAESALQHPGTAACPHPVAGRQESVVQGSPSSHETGVPGWHAPDAHASPSVHALRSSQGSEFAACSHPVAGSHPSVVHGFPSPQATGVPAHAPTTQVSSAVQALASSHGSVLATCRQPTAVSQASVVQAFPSSQSAGAGVEHVPPTRQVEATVKSRPLHEDPGHWESSRHSTHVGAAPNQVPRRHRGSSPFFVYPTAQARGHVLPEGAPAHSDG